MKNLCYMLFWAMALISCKEHHETVIVIRNGTDYKIRVDLNSRPGASGVQHVLDLDTITRSSELYRIDLADSDPRQLLSAGYHSFVVEVDNPDQDRLVFGMNTEPNYALDPYTDLGSWQNETYDMTYHYQFSSQERLVQEFTFIISEDLIVK